MTASDSEPDFEGGAEDNGAREDEGEQDKDEGDNGQHLLVVGSDDTPAARGRNCVLKQWFAEVTHLKDMRGNGGLVGSVIKNKINFVYVDYDEMTSSEKYVRTVIGDPDT